MKNLYTYKFLLFCLLLTFQIKLECNDYVITHLDNPAPGYYRFGEKPTFFLFDNYGTYHFEDSTHILKPSFSKLLENGLWADFTDNGINLFNQDLQLVDSIPCPVGYNFDNHDIISLSNGNYLLLCNEFVPIDMSQIVNDGQADAVIVSNVLIETDRTGIIYWQWRFIDHIQISDATYDVPLSTSMVDLTHTNSLFEAPDGNIITSSRHIDEVTKINKNTGEIIWRMGGSACKNNQFSFQNDNQNGFIGFSHQHTATLLPNGNLLLFDNGNLKDPPQSRAVEYQLDEVNKTVTKIWEYRSSESIFATAMGSAYRLPNGNTLINWTNNRFTEVKPDNTIAFELVSTSNFGIYRCFKYITKMNANTKTISSPGNFDFNDAAYTTGVNLNLTDVTGNGLLWIEKHDYAPPRAEFLDSCFSKILPFRWVAGSNDISNMSGTITIKLNTISNYSDPSKLSIYKRNRETTGLFLELNTTYNSNTGELSAPFTGLGEFIVAEIAVLSAPNLVKPANNSKKITPIGKYNWQRVFGASKYQIQISTDQDIKEIVLDSAFDYMTEFTSGKLEYYNNYYWRVKSLNSKNSSNWSQIYTFRTEIKPPDLYIPVNETTNFNFSYALKWEKVKGATNYRIQIAKNENFSNIAAEIKNNELDSVRINTLDFNTKYYWRVMGFESSDSSRWSNVSHFTTLLAPPKKRTPINNSINISVSGQMTWDYAQYADNYGFEVATDSLFTEPLLKIENLKTSSYFYSNLSFNTKYFWRLRAYSSTNSSEWSDVWNFTTVLAPPKLTSPANKSKSVSTNPVLMWEKVENAQYYSLQASYNSSFSDIFIKAEKITDNKYIINELPINKTIYWKVEAFNDKGQKSHPSEIWSFTTENTNPLQIPELVSPKNDSTSNIKGYFSWKAVDNALKYHLQVATTKDFTVFVINASERTDTIYRYTDLEYNQEYYWRVKALNLNDTSQWSEVWTMKTPKLKLIKLIEPENEMLQVELDGQLVWEEIPDADYYWVQLSSDKDFSNLIIDQQDVKTDKYKFSGLEQKKDYYWRVRYFSDKDTSNWSNVWSFSTSYPNQLSAPILNSPNDNYTAVPVNGSLDWTEVNNAKSYKLTVSKETDFDEVDIKETGITELEYDYSELDYNQQYFWKVAASNDNSDSPWSETRSFLTELKTPYLAAPDDLATEQCVDGTLIWVEVDGSNRYHLQIAMDSLFQIIEIDLPVIYEPVYKYRLSVKTTYYWKVKALNDKNYSQWSEVKSFTTENVTDVEGLNNDNNITICPNPATDIITINISPALLGSNYLISDLSGKAVLKGKLLSDISSFNIEFLPLGIYFIQIGEKNKKTYKFFKN